jgi:hypothetical protein
MNESLKQLKATWRPIARMELPLVLAIDPGVSIGIALLHHTAADRKPMCPWADEWAFTTPEAFAADLQQLIQAVRPHRCIYEDFKGGMGGGAQAATNQVIGALKVICSFEALTQVSHPNSRKSSTLALARKLSPSPSRHAKDAVAHGLYYLLNG